MPKKINHEIDDMIISSSYSGKTRQETQKEIRERFNEEISTGHIPRLLREMNAFHMEKHNGT